MLKLENIYSYYGKSPIIQDMSVHVPEGGFLAVLGRNGVGKTTLLRSILGLTDKMDGSIHFNGVNLTNLATAQRVPFGIGYIPQGRQIIPKFTVRENILMGTYARTDGERKIPDYIFEMFPILKEFLKRKGGDLSGGQQQQLAIARALAMKPKMLVLDEPTEGIQPNVVRQIEETIIRLNKEFGLTIILVEQNIPFAREASDQFVLMDKGQAILEGATSELTDQLVEKHLAF
jgi:urea transport system ATP-binding protein